MRGTITVSVGMHYKTIGSGGTGHACPHFAATPMLWAAHSPHRCTLFTAKCLQYSSHPDLPFTFQMIGSESAKFPFATVTVKPPETVKDGHS